MSSGWPTRRVIARVVPPVALGLVIALVVALVVVAPAPPERDLDLNNSGVWVSSDAAGVFGRVNRSAGAVDTVLMDPEYVAGAGLDVLQDQQTVVGLDTSAGRVFPVDTRDGVVTEGSDLLVDATGQVALGGGILAWVSGVTGEIRMTAYGEDEPVVPAALLSEATVAARLDGVGAGASGVDVAVDGSGRVLAAAVSGSWVLLVPGAPAVTGTVGPLESVVVTLVAGVGLIADAATGEITSTTGA
ncbi:MAG: hypothetical protein LBI33_04370, partial [Propionibacteriaceae bacterium]|nr:hypothetical protein [Propionibacteriaceae bacterium]